MKTLSGIGRFGLTVILIAFPQVVGTRQPVSGESDKER